MTVKFFHMLPMSCWTYCKVLPMSLVHLIFYSISQHLCRKECCNLLNVLLWYFSLYRSNFSQSQWSVLTEKLVWISTHIRLMEWGDSWAFMLGSFSSSFLLPLAYMCLLRVSSLAIRCLTGCFACLYCIFTAVSFGTGFMPQRGNSDNILCKVCLITLYLH